MEHMGLEPTTSTLPVWRAPNCANAPKQMIYCRIYYNMTDREIKTQGKKSFISFANT